MGNKLVFGTFPGLLGAVANYSFVQDAWDSYIQGPSLDPSNSNLWSVNMMDMPNTPMADSGGSDSAQQPSQQPGVGQQQANNMFAAPYLGSGSGSIM